MKFKEGDKVKLVRMEDENTNSYKKYLGQEFEIETIYNTTEPHCTLKGNNEIAPYIKNLELVKKYTYKDLKKSPIGTKITFENGEVLVKDEENYFENVNRCREIANLYNLKDSYSDLGKIIKIEEPEYKKVYEYKPEILDKAEKRYLRRVIRPFRDKVTYIRKFVYSTGDAKIDIVVENWYICLPTFPKNQMYKNMEDDKEYTLEELGL